MTYFKIAVSIVLASLLLGCSEDTSATKSVQSVVEQKAQEVADSVDKAEKAAEVVVKEAALETKNTVENVAKSVDETTHKAVAHVKEAAKEATQKVEEAIAPVAIVSGADLYKACASCHGQNGEKAALGKSQIIQGWDAGKIADALHGYKDGTYGGAMKNVMKGQSSKLSDTDIQALSAHISKL